MGRLAGWVFLRVFLCRSAIYKLHVFVVVNEVRAAVVHSVAHYQLQMRATGCTALLNTTSCFLFISLFITLSSSTYREGVCLLHFNITHTHSETEEMHHCSLKISSVFCRQF